MDLFQQVDELKQQQASRPAPAALRKSAWDQTVLEWTYHSNTLSGSSLNLVQTQKAMSGVMVGGKSLEENHAAMGHKRAIDLIALWCDQKKANLHGKDLQKLYGVLIQGTGRRHNTSYRRGQCEIEISGITMADPAHISTAVESFLSDYNKQCKLNRNHALQRAVFLHAGFLAILPFEYRNTVMARCLLNYELMRNQYLPIVIPVSDKEFYFKLCLKAQAGKIDELTQYFGQLQLKVLKTACESTWQLFEGFV